MADIGETLPPVYMEKQPFEGRLEMKIDGLDVHHFVMNGPAERRLPTPVDLTEQSRRIEAWLQPHHERVADPEKHEQTLLRDIRFSRRANAWVASIAIANAFTMAAGGADWSASSRAAGVGLTCAATRALLEIPVRRAPRAARKRAKEEIEKSQGIIERGQEALGILHAVRRARFTAAYDHADGS